MPKRDIKSIDIIVLLDFNVAPVGINTDQNVS